MSYILDALKRADAERSNSQPAEQGQEASAERLSPAFGSRSAANRQVLVVAAALLLCAALAAWWVLRPAEPAGGTRPPGGATTPPGAPAAMAPEARPTAQVTPSPGSGAALPAASAGPQMPGKAPPMVGPPLPSARVLAPASPPFEGPAPVRPRPTPTPDTQVANNTAGAASEPIVMAPGAAPAPGVPAAAPALPVTGPAPAPSLPAHAPSPSAAPSAPPQSSDGSIKVSGASYSANPAHRLLIVNGNLVKEGQEVEPGVILEVISPHSAVFNRRGTRFNVNY
ncbi:general secretion pathway protein GspB [Hydrogenophaga sp.]|uniref:general secretion pathway protein GspB n=1 Tax=Hydrogenophaga sp. TaxID=1904254 RepID=UPI0035AE5378